MNAIHKQLGLKVKVINVNNAKDVFCGRVTFQGQSTWKIGEICRDFYKGDFDIYLTWEEVTEINVTIANLRESLYY